MTTIIAFLFVLGVLVFVHELGHFLVARWYGVRVITFSLGFGLKIVKFVRGGTEYCISVIPLGGYVKLAGETVDDARTGQPDEFLSKSKWVRFQVYLAGPVMNILLAIVVLAGVLAQGADVPLFDSSAPVVGRVDEGSPAGAVGIRAGDRVLSVDGKAVGTWEDFNMAVLPRGGRELSIVIDRNGETVPIRVTPEVVGRYELGNLGVHPIMRPQVLGVTPDSPAEQAGFAAGDVLVSINGERGLRQEEIIDRIRSHAGQQVVFTVERSGRETELTAVPRGATGAATIGVALSPWEVRRVDPSLLEATRMSVERNWENTVLIGRTLRGLFTRDTPVRQLMGPIGIAEMSGNAAEIGFAAIFNLMAMISLNLGLLNLMPVPVLDGGHIAILAVEGVARRDLSVRVKERILMAGAAVIVLLMATVIYNDIARLLR
jgi:regulator of sigma E protease